MADVTLTYRGKISEIQGQKFQVPSSIPLESRAAWIESNWREQQAREAAEQERQEREQRLLQERIEATRQENLIGNLKAELSQMADRIEELNDRIVAEPDTEAMLRWNAASAGIYERSLGLADEVEAMQATVTDLLAKATAMAEAAAIGEELQQQALNLLKNQQKMTAGSFSTYAAELQRLRDETNAAQIQVGALNTEAQDSRDVIQQAANIQQEAVNIAEREARRAVGEMQGDFMDVLALSLRALGLRESDLIATANSIATAPNSSGTIRRASVERFIEISRKTNDAVEQARGEFVE